MIPTDDIFSTMLERLAEEKNLFDENIREKFESLGFETVWLVTNLGSVTFFAGLYLIMLAYLYLLKLLSKCSGNAYKRYRRLKPTVFWSWPINFLSENYLVITTCCLIQIQHRSWTNSVTSLNTNLAILLMILLIVYPILIQCFLHNRREQLRKRNFRKKYGSAYDGLKEKDNKYLYYPLIFYSRRVLLPMIVLYYHDIMMTQYITVTMSGVGTISLIGL